MADSLIKALLVEDLEIPVFVEKEFNVRCCIRGYHIYQIQWNTGIGARLTTAPETRPGALAEDKYAIAVTNNGKTVGHVPKFLTKLTFFFLKNAGKLHITVTGPRRYSVDLKQGGLGLPVDFCFTSLNEKLFLQMKEKTLEEVQKYEKQKKGVEQEIEKKETERGKKKKSEAFFPSNLVRVIYIFPLIISAAL